MPADRRWHSTKTASLGRHRSAGRREGGRAEARGMADWAGAWRTPERHFLDWESAWRRREHTRGQFATTEAAQPSPSRQPRFTQVNYFSAAAHHASSLIDDFVEAMKRGDEEAQRATRTCGTHP